MLLCLVPPPRLLRASSQLPRQLELAHPLHIRLRAASNSSSSRYVSDSTYVNQDAEEHNDRASSRHPQTKNTASSHFFDARVPAPTCNNTASLTRPKVSHEVASASRQAVNTFRQAISTREPAAIIEAYTLLTQAHERQVQDVRDSSSTAAEPYQTKFPVRKNDIQTAIRYLVQHSQTEGRMECVLVEACQQMFEDMNQRFGFRIGPTDLHRQLQVFCLSSDQSLDLRDAFLHLRASYPEWQTTSIEWNLVISHLARRRSYKHAIKVWHDMSISGVTPSADLRNTMIRVFTAVIRTGEAEDQRLELAREEASISPDDLPATVMSLCELVLSNTETSLERMDKLRKHVNQLQREVESNPQMANNTASWNALLRYEALVVSPAHARQTARQVYKPGMFDYSTLCVLLRLHTEELNELQSSEDALELLDQVQSAIDPSRSIALDDECYSILMFGLLSNSVSEDTPNPSPNQIHEAQLLYDHVCSTGIPPTPLLVTPLLRAYCEAFLPSLPSAMKLVDDLLAQQPITAAPSSRLSGSTRRKAPRSLAFDMAIISPVLDACVKLKDLSSARNLLSRLHEAGITMSVTDKSKLLRRLIGITTSWPEAFHMYRSLSRFRTSSSAGSRTSEAGLDERGYMSLLESLCALTFPDPRSSSSRLPAPPEELLGIVEDMRAAGHRPWCVIYTSILDYYSKTTPPCYVGVQATHEMLKRDEGLEPDLPLINALMNAYNRVGEPAMVLAIWNSLMATRQEIDGVTLSVFFDTAGRHGLLSLARKAIRTVRQIEVQDKGESVRSVLTKGAWDSWLECLARCGRLEEAIELAFGEMRKALLKEAMNAHDLDSVDAGITANELVARSAQAPVKNRRGHVVGPDAKTFGVLLRFAARERDRRQKRSATNLLPGPISGARSGSIAASGTSIWHTLRTRIREEYSWLYPQVKHIGEQTVL